MEHPLRDFHGQLKYRNAKSPAFQWKAGLAIRDLRLALRLSLELTATNQPRVRERIMKLSKVYSATCHQRYSSER